MNNFMLILTLFITFMIFPCSFIITSRKDDLDGADCAVISIIVTMIVGIISMLLYITSRQ